MTTMDIVRMDSDDDRASVEELFRENISDPTRFPLLPSGVDPHQGYVSYLLTVVEDGRIVAALHAAPPVVEVLQLLGRGLPEVSGAAALRDFVMLYSIATVETHRRNGLGALLLSRLHELARADGFSCVYGVSEGVNVPFYQNSGYTVLDRGQTLIVKWGERASGFPVTGDVRWFTRMLDLESPPCQTDEKSYSSTRPTTFVSRLRRLLFPVRP